MRRFTSAQERAVVAANYIGGLGYYLWHISWIVTCVYVLLEASRYVVVGTGPIYQTPSSTAAHSVADPLAASSYLASLLAVVLVAVCVFGLPYYVGWLSRGLPRWVLAQTSWELSISKVLRIKQLLCLVLAVIAVLLLFSPDRSGGENIASIVVMGSTILASVLFLAQHAIAAHWDIPERRVF